MDHRTFFPPNSAANPTKVRPRSSASSASFGSHPSGGLRCPSLSGASRGTFAPTVNAPEGAEGRVIVNYLKT